tara:strand:- start:289 stop:939 length:651 start_codon:yes stop_codon:yes gene_type:complete
MSTVTETRAAIKEALLGDVLETETEDENLELTEEIGTQTDTEEQAEVELVELEKKEPETKTEDKTKDKTKEKALAEIENLSEEPAETKTQVDPEKHEISEKYETLQQETKQLKKELKAAKAVLKQTIDNDLKNLGKEDLELVQDFAGSDDVLKQFRALTLLKKHGKIGNVQTEKPKRSRVAVDKTRVSKDQDTITKPRGLNETRRAVVEQFKKLAK